MKGLQAPPQVTVGIDCQLQNQAARQRFTRVMDGTTVQHWLLPLALLPR